MQDNQEKQIVRIYRLLEYRDRRGKTFFSESICTGRGVELWHVWQAVEYADGSRILNELRAPKS